MNKYKYIGHTLQLYGVEEYTLHGGKGNQTHIFHVRNGAGLELFINADRCSDISRLTYDGVNMNYMSTCGYVKPEFYSPGSDGFGFLKSFQCGFMTTCGFDNIGVPNVDVGVSHALHGTISNTPAEYVYHTINDDIISIHSTIKDHVIFGRKFTLERTLEIPLFSNTFAITDTITNEGSTDEPLMLLYHINLGYPLIDENSELTINSSKIVARDDEAQKGINEWNQIISPVPNYAEQCFYHFYDSDNASMTVYNPLIHKGISINFDTREFPLSVEWKMMGERDYVLGLEPCTSLLDGRHKIRKNGNLNYLKPGESKQFHTNFVLHRKPIM
ncbi:aldose 1-epimerase family protein [Anaerostipes sp.]|uniref:aldose 1-epimerase family protein n=1 Tax=Anaerostipes sp. TaxID=1872530 RepID=UPI0035279A76